MQRFSSITYVPWSTKRGVLYVYTINFTCTASRKNQRSTRVGSNTTCNSGLVHVDPHRNTFLNRWFKKISHSFDICTALQLLWYSPSAQHASPGRPAAAPAYVPRRGYVCTLLTPELAPCTYGCLSLIVTKLQAPDLTRGRAAAGPAPAESMARSWRSFPCARQTSIEPAGTAAAAGACATATRVVVVRGADGMPGWAEL